MRPLDAGTLAGALADDDRRAVFAAVQLGACDVAQICASTRLAQPVVARALGRLVDIGVVVESGGVLVVLGAAFQHAARQALARPPRTEHAEQPADVQAVLNVFVVDGRIIGHPSAPGKRRVVLDWLAQDFQPGLRYPERQANTVLQRRVDDFVTWRRYLVDDGFLDRADGEYWRAGGSVPTSGSAHGGC